MVGRFNGLECSQIGRFEHSIRFNRSFHRRCFLIFRELCRQTISFRSFVEWATSLGEASWLVCGTILLYAWCCSSIFNFVEHTWSLSLYFLRKKIMCDSLLFSNPIFIFYYSFNLCRHWSEKNECSSEIINIRKIRHSQQIESIQKERFGKGIFGRLIFFQNLFIRVKRSSFFYFKECRACL